MLKTLKAVLTIAFGLATFALMPSMDEVPDGCLYELRVEGTKGLPFSGSYTTIAADGTTLSTAIAGFVPTTYGATGAVVWVDLQKQSDSGVLAVKVLRDCTILGKRATRAAYGAVSLITRLT